MAQGTIKKSKTTPSSSRRPSALSAKKGQRTIAPKKKALVKQKKITKKYTSGLIGKTERALAEKAGHLEMLGGGKRKGGGEGKKV
ncbi:hypothetical protein JMJ35_008347 [Cladonia borealis]|uniref:Uncharacterized protein n=1 Tax=Cladonia borealis TaxID=184061 RepID=A0AA39U6P1_9LECA|nr:hypothetical protein JMJ35_008347 [Cladonia borealis]